MVYFFDLDMNLNNSFSMSQCLRIIRSAALFIISLLSQSSFASSNLMCLTRTGGAKKGQAGGQVGEDIARTCRVLSSEAGCFPQSQQTESRSRQGDKFVGGTYMDGSGRVGI